MRDTTLEAYERIQIRSRERHVEINRAIVQLINETGGDLRGFAFEAPCGSKRYMQTDGRIKMQDRLTNFEFHHKAGSETTNNKVAIYILEKLKEYAINYGLATR